ncbi:uncharacterized protein LOC126824279 isoform X2 [Patella vulgata]|uniref:uncharacterized protein LOC126824279 isoform X2 n=1 Tax=Patella vulgata TaxID=6465 RepID=UPI0024A9B592|nr:uncharacterized protein LOC126824279 isoform X2 [Patella vulgata]
MALPDDEMAEIRDCRPSQQPLIRSYFKGYSKEPLRNETIAELLAESCDGDPERIVYKIPEFGQSMTAQQIKSKSDEVSKGLLGLRVTKGDVVMVTGVVTKDFFALFHGVVGIGAIFFNTFLFPPRDQSLLSLLDKVQPKVLIYCCKEEDDPGMTALRHLYISLEPSCYKPTSWLTFQDFITNNTPIDDAHLATVKKSVVPNDTAYLLSSSGTTGDVRLSCISHYTLVNYSLFCELRRNPFNKKQVIAFLNPNADDLLAVFESLIVLAFWREQMVGVFLPSSANFGEGSSDVILKIIEDMRITTLQVYPAWLYYIYHNSNRTKYDLSSLRSGMIASQTVSIEMKQWFGKNHAEYISAYGLTEFLAGLVTSPAFSTFDKFLRTSGYPVSHIECKLVDDTGSIVPVESIGEILLKGWSMTIGYFNVDGEPTPVADSGGWFHTGDVGTMDETGHVVIIGRKADGIRFKHFGDVVYPQVIENIAHQHPAVNDAVVVGIASDFEGDIICLCVSLKQDEGQVSGEELLSFCDEQLTERNCPDYCLVFDNLAKVGSRRKISRALVLETAKERLQNMEEHKRDRL